MLNNVSLVGRAGADPKVQNFEKGKLARLNLAVKEPIKDGDTNWFEVQAWGKQAEIAEQYLKKGHVFGVEGRLKQEKWTKDGVDHTRVVVVARDLRLMTPNKGEPKKAEGNDFFGDDSTFDE